MVIRADPPPCPSKRNNHHGESGRDCCIAISPFFCRDLPAYPQVPHLHGNEKTLAQCQDRRFLWGILTSAVLSSLPNGSLPSFTYGRASDALTFCVLLRIPRLRPPLLPSNILMPTAVSLWAFLRPVRDPAAAARHPFLRFAANQISEYGGTIYGL